MKGPIRKRVASLAYLFCRHEWQDITTSYPPVDELPPDWPAAMCKTCGKTKPISQSPDAIWRAAGITIEKLVESEAGREYVWWTVRDRSAGYLRDCRSEEEANAHAEQLYARKMK